MWGEEISDTLAYVFENDDPGLPFVIRDSKELILDLKCTIFWVSTSLLYIYIYKKNYAVIYPNNCLFFDYLELLLAKASADTIVCGAV